MEPWLTIVLIGAGIILYTSLFNRTNDKSNDSKLLASMEQSFEQFAMDLEEDNNRLLEHVLVLKEQLDEQNADMSNRIEQLEKQLDEHQKGQRLEQRLEQDLKQSTLVYKPPAVRQPEKLATHKMNIRERYEQLFEFHDAGKSIDYIAKKCEMNKGEVQLILQLGMQEERASV